MTNFPFRAKTFFSFSQKKKKKRTNSLQIYSIHDNCHPNHEHIENIPPTRSNPNKQKILSKKMRKKDSGEMEKGRGKIGGQK